MRPYAAKMSTCPRRGCGGAANPIFCSEDWLKVSPPTKRKILSLWRIMGRNRSQPPEGFISLLETAVHEIHAVPAPILNAAERMAVALHAAVVGGARV